jgi:tricorn protease
VRSAPGLLLTLLSFSILLAAAAPAVAGEGYLRQPDIHGDAVVFVAEADLWIASTEDGMARRLTRHVGNERSPKFSPNGQWIAFTGQYDGNSDVFVVAATGGEPQRLTWHPATDGVIGWSPDGKKILFSSRRDHPHGSMELFSVPATGGDAEKLPLGWATYVDFERQQGRWAFTRVRGGGTWKRYRGGTARSIWVGDPGKMDFHQVTEFEGMNAFPMWREGRIYYLGDAGGTANIWSMKPDGSDHQRHTDLGKWDARFPSMGPDGRIVFMLAGDIHLFDPASGKERKLPIDLPSDRVLTRSRYPDAAHFITWLDLSSDGERLAVTTRGEIFSVPVKKGVTLPVTRGSGARESWASFDAKGEHLLYVTDEPREEEIRMLDAWGRGEPEVVKTAGNSGWHFPPSMSPDGEWVAYSDESQTLYVVPAEGGKPTAVDHSDQAAITHYTWSPDSRWLAYRLRARTDYDSIFIYDMQEKAKHRITGDDTDDVSPAWDPEGRYLYFVGHRTTNPLLDVRDLQNVNIKPSRLYMVLLRDDVENPFAERAGLPPADDADEDEEEKDEAAADGDADADGDEADKESEEKKDGEDDKEKAKPIEIDFDGIADRIVQMPVPAGQYGSLGATKGKVFFISQPLIGMADWGPLFGPAQPTASLMAFDLESKKADTFIGGVAGYNLSAKAGKLAVMKGPGEIYVVGAASPPGDLSEAKVALGGVVVEVDPREEWEQIYYEGWRHMREYYWDPGLGSVDWDAVRDQYATLLPRLANRDDLRDLIAEMIGELSTSHTYVFGGDQGVAVPRRSTGLLGADLLREGDAFKVETIYRGAPADNERAPLLEPGVGVKEGDYILQVNHMPFSSDRPFHANLEGLADRPVVLTVNSKPDLDGARDVAVVPLSNGLPVRYADWVRRNRERVAKETDGRIGYIHIPDMMGDGLIEFNTWFFPQLDKEGMVIDVRWNGGGFVSEMILERLRRPLVSFGRSRGGSISTYPARTLNGPFVVLTNEFAGSDGDILPAAIQLEGLAPVIGMRSWGGVVGISSIRPLVDGGLMTQPETAWWDPQLGWGLENHGVDPDIEVQNLPQDLARGLDPQLTRGIAEVLELHQKQPPVAPRFGPVRPRGRDDYRKELALIEKINEEARNTMAVREKEEEADSGSR